MRKLRKSRILILLVLLISITACAAKQLPSGYEVLKTDASILEISEWYKTIRASYVAARTANLMPPAAFLLAVKADESFTKVWNIYIEARKAGNDTAAMWSVVISKLGVLEGLASQWLSASTLDKRPLLLGGK